MKPWLRLARMFRGKDTKASTPLCAPDPDWTPTHRHRKGGLYRVVGHGILEADRTDAVIYDDAEGTVWIRPTSEFMDGRFESLPADTQASP